MGMWGKTRDFLGLTILEWIEPPTFLSLLDRYEDRQVVWWVKPLSAFCVMLLCLVYFYGMAAIKGKSPPAFWRVGPLSLGLGFFAIYAGPWFNRLSRSRVRLNARSLTRQRGHHRLVVPFKTVSHYEWLQNNDHITLAIYRVKSRPCLFGVPDAATRDKVDALLREAGVKPSVS